MNEIFTYTEIISLLSFSYVKMAKNTLRRFFTFWKRNNRLKIFLKSSIGIEYLSLFPKFDYDWLRNKVFILRELLRKKMHWEKFWFTFNSALLQNLKNPSTSLCRYFGPLSICKVSSKNLFPVLLTKFPTFHFSKWLGKISHVHYVISFAWAFWKSRDAPPSGSGSYTFRQNIGAESFSRRVDVPVTENRRLDNNYNLLYI